MTQVRALIAILAVPLLLPLVPGQTHTSKVDVPMSLVLEPLEIARRALNRGNAEQAIRAYQEILDQHAEEVITVRETPRSPLDTDPVLPGDIYRGVRSEVMDLIVELPEDGLTTYREMMEPRAARLLEEALRRGSERLLRDVAVRYYLTDSGQKAFMGLVDLLLEAGRVEEARIHARRLLRHSTDWPSGRPVLATARLGVSLFAVGRREALQQLQERVGSDGLGGELLVAGSTTGLGTFLGKLVDALPAETGEEIADLTQLDAFRSEIWEAGIESADRESAPTFFSWGVSLSRPWFDYNPVVPLIHNGVLYYCDGLRLSARSLFTGERLWPDVKSHRRSHVGRRNHNLFFKVALDGDLLLAYLEDEPYSERMQAWVGFNPIEAVPSRKLVAVDAQTGRVRWSHVDFVGEDPGETAFIKGLSVNAPPVAAGERLYVAGTLYHGVFRHWICALQRDTGHVIWRTFVAEGQLELNMFGNPIKEAVVGHLVEHQGVLYYCTNMGVISAVDAATGSIQWISAYEQEPIPATRTQANRERYPGWMPAQPAVWKDKVFVAPTDSYELYAADMRTGDLTPVPAARRNRRTRNSFFLGIHENLLLVAGLQVTAIDPDSLSEVWTSARLAASRGEGQGAVHGLPAVAEGRMIFTTEVDGQAEAYKLDLETGMMTNRVVLPDSRATGHVVLSPEGAAIGSSHRVRVYYDLADLERRLEAARMRNPADPDVYLRLGEIRWRKEQHSLALDDFHRALDLARAQGRAGAARVRRAEKALYGLWRELARQPRPGSPITPSSVEDRYEKALSFAHTDAEKVATLVDLLYSARDTDNNSVFISTARRLLESYPAHRIEVDRRILEMVPALDQEGTSTLAGLAAALAAGRVLEEQGRHREAVDFYQEVILRFPDAVVGGESAWNYGGKAIERLMETAGRTIYSAQDRRARELLRKGRSGDDLSALRAVLQRYPQSSVVEEAYLELTRRLLEAGSYHEALQEMQHHMSRFGRVSAPALAKYARCLDELGARGSALQILHILADAFGQEMVRVGDRRLQARAWAEEMMGSPPYRALESEHVPALASETPELLWTHDPERPRDTVRLVHPQGRVPDAARGVVLFHRAGRMGAVDAAGGDVLWRLATHTYPWPARWHDGRLLAVLDGDVVALDPTVGRELWRNRLEGRRVLDLHGGHGKVYVLAASDASQGSLSLLGLNIVTGETVQVTSLDAFDSPALRVGTRHVLVTSRNRTLVMDALTGEVVPRGVWRYRPNSLRPVLTESGSVIVSAGGSRRRQGGALRLLAVDPSDPRNVLWEYSVGEGDIQELGFDGRHLAFMVREEHRQQGRNYVTSTRRVVLLDTAKGRVACDVELGDGEIATDAAVRDRRLFIKYRKYGNRAGNSTRAVRAVDIRTGGVLWETPPYLGGELTLRMLPARGHLLVRRSDMSLRRRSTVAPPGSVYLIDLESGTTVYEIEIEELSFTPETPNFGLYKGNLVIASGSRISGYGK